MNYRYLRLFFFLSLCLFAIRGWSQPRNDSALVCNKYLHYKLHNDSVILSYQKFKTLTLLTNNLYNNYELCKKRSIIQDSINIDYSNLLDSTTLLLDSCEKYSIKLQKDLEHSRTIDQNIKLNLDYLLKERRKNTWKGIGIGVGVTATIAGILSLIL